MSTIHVDIVSAEGEIGIAPRHAPLLTTMRAGEVRLQDLNEAAAQLRAIEKLRQLRKGG